MDNSSALADLESSIQNYKVFIDTCALLSDEAEKFWSNIVPILYKNRAFICLPLNVYAEIANFASSEKHYKGKQLGLHQRAKKVLAELESLKQNKLVTLVGKKEELKDSYFADNVLLAGFTKMRLKHNLILITKDNNLALDILNLKQHQSVHSQKDICVKKITKDGFLTDFTPAKHNSSSSHTKQAQGKANAQGSEARDCFALATSITNVSGDLVMTIQPKEGSTVFAGEDPNNRNSIQLLEKLSAGGEGTIFKTNILGIVAKIYFPRKITKAKYEKLRLMLSKRIIHDGICFPLDPLYNQANEFVGYLMPEAKGKVLQHCVFIPRLLSKHFPHWNKVDTVQLCVTILEKLTYLHERNVILGDINPSNILVVSPKEVYFVDTDSYQIEGFPCPVGTINYTAPEIQRKNFSTFLRTKGNENFAVATLLFMIMLPGKPPYSLQGGDNQIDNIINGDFAYPSGKRSNGKAPEGMWRYCWSHLPRSLKDDFYETFRKGGANYEADSRFSSKQWLGKFRNYLNLLQNGIMANNDEMSMQIFPTRFKRQPNVTYVQCRECHQEFAEDRLRDGVCFACRRKEVSVRCKKCFREFNITLGKQLASKGHTPDMCPECIKTLKTAYAQPRCSACGQLFVITVGEKEFLESKGLNLPKRCPNCRKNNTHGSNQSSNHTNGLSGLFRWLSGL